MRTTRIFNITNHQLTKEQVDDLDEKFVNFEIITLPEHLQELWGQVPPDADMCDIKDIRNQILDFLEGQETKYVKHSPDALAIIQGETTLVYALVSSLAPYPRYNWGNQYMGRYWLGILPVAATSQRVSTEVENPDGTVTKKSVFKHVRFRHYF